jgi:hypothetical protein
MIYDEFDKLVFNEIDTSYLPLEQLKVIDAVLASKEDVLETLFIDYLWELRNGKEI